MFSRDHEILEIAYTLTQNEELWKLITTSSQIDKVGPKTGFIEEDK